MTRIVHAHRCTNCGRYSDQCRAFGPGYFACPSCDGSKRWAIRGRTCSLCLTDNRRTVIYHGAVVCAFCLTDKELLYLFRDEPVTPEPRQEDDRIIWGLLAAGFLLLALFTIAAWLM